MRIFYFAWIKEALSKSQDTLTIEAMPLSKLLEILKSRGPNYQEIFSKPEKLCIAVNDGLISFNDTEYVVQKDDEISFFPPVSGG